MEKKKVDKKRIDKAMDNPEFRYSTFNTSDGKNALIIEWQAKNIGFGNFTFYYDEGQMCCDSEYMGRDFVKAALCAMVDNCKFTEIGDNEDVPPRS